MNAQEKDILVIGGGMVGAAFAAAAAREGLSVALVDAQAPKTFTRTSATDLRVSALSRASQRILENLGAWPMISAVRIAPYRDMRVWDSQGNGQVEFSAAELGEATLGHIVENGLTRHALWQALQTRSDLISIHAPDGVASLTETESHIEAALDSGAVVRAKLVVAADGANSATRKRFSIDVSGDSYGQRGLVAAVQGEKSHGEVARQRFLPGGPLAMLPLYNDRVSIVWSLPEQEAERLLKASDEEFLAELTEASEGALGKMVSVSERAAFPLRRQHAGNYVLPRVALIGDAAHVVHPLAGQGANLGFLDAAALAEVLGAAHRDGRDIGSLRTLRKYERWRKGDNLATLWTMDGFKKLFSNEDTVLAKLRNTGFSIFNRIEPLKHAAIRRAMGLESGLAAELPVLAKN